MSSETDKASCLVVVLDVGSLLINKETEKLSKVVDALTLFCNSYNVMHRNNQLIVLLSSGSAKSIELDADTNLIIEKLRKSLNGARTLDEVRSLSRCLSSALCVINSRLSSSFQSRVLIIQFDRDVAINYNGVMNSIFSSQKLNVCIDSLVICPSDSHLMQQACFLTNGLYLRHTDFEDFNRLLHIHFLSDKSTRQHLVLPMMKSVDFKSACRCHKKLVQFAYMCSVCLALSCSITPKCLSCDTPAAIV